MMIDKFDGAAREIDKIICEVGFSALQDMFNSETKSPDRVAFEDQAGAAQAQMETMFRSLPAVGTVVSRETEWGHHPEWARLGLLRSQLRWVQGESRLCSHKPQATRPQPVAAFAWKPNFVACARCSHRATPQAGSVEHYTCDACGKVGEDMVTDSALFLGPFMYTFGCCDTCAYW
jgi:hypothetical protein